MSDPKEPLQFADEHIAEIQSKLAGNTTKGPTQEEIFARINGLDQVKPNIVEPGISPLQRALTEAKADGPLSFTPGLQTESSAQIKALRTFQGDVAEAIKNQGTSVLSIALAEKRREQEQAQKQKSAGLTPTPIIPKTELPTTPSLKQQAVVIESPVTNAPVTVKSAPVNHEARNKGILITLSAFFILLGIGAVGMFYMFQKNTPLPVAKESRNKTLVAYNKASAITVDTATEDELFETINRQRRDNVLSNNETFYVSLVLTATDDSLQPISSPAFFALFKQNAPASLIRAFGSKMMFGFYKTTQNEPFLLIQVESFDNAYAGMLEWEKLMNADIGALFTNRTLSITEVIPPTGSSTATTTTQRTLNADIANAGAFEDETIKNKDIRILRTKQGDTILLYSFIDKNTLIITSSTEVLSTMVNKIADQKLVR